jgi:hypothetical protein
VPVAGRARNSHRSCCPSALPCPESQPVVLSTKIVVRVLTPMHAEASRTTVMGTGVGESDARRRGLARRHARRSRARNSHRSCCPSALPCPESHPVVLSAPNSLCAARRRHMTPYRVLVVQSRRPLRMAMGHTSGALRSRNSASSAPGPASGRKKRLDGGWRGFVPEKRRKRKPNVPGCLGWLHVGSKGSRRGRLLGVSSLPSLPTLSIIRHILWTCVI